MAFFVQRRAKAGKGGQRRAKAGKGGQRRAKAGKGGQRRAKAGQKAGFRVTLKCFEIKKAFRYYIKQIDSMLPCI